jgi:hypothetical protein
MTTNRGAVFKGPGNTHAPNATCVGRLVASSWGVRAIFDPGRAVGGPKAEATMHRFLMAVVGLGLTILSACATTGAPGVTHTTSAVPPLCYEEGATCVRNADCCNANCFYGTCERPEQE